MPCAHGRVPVTLQGFESDKKGWKPELFTWFIILKLKKRNKAVEKLCKESSRSHLIQ